jgi:hypothetical protein
MLMLIDTVVCPTTFSAYYTRSQRTPCFSILILQATYLRGFGPCSQSLSNLCVYIIRFQLDVVRCDADGTPLVATLDDVWDFARSDLSRLADHFGPAVLSKIRAGLAKFTRTTACSGIDSPGVGLCTIAGALARIFNDDTIQPARHLAATEWDLGCQSELLGHPNLNSRPAHIFSDQESFWSHRARRNIDALVQKGVKCSFDMLEPLAMSPNAVKSHAHCIVCNRLCAFPSAFMHIAGLPCVNWSSFGDQTGDAGYTIFILACWIAQRLSCQEPVIVLEESDRFKLDLMHRTLGHMYVIQGSLVCPTSRGFPIKRMRLWAVLTHKTFVSSCTASLENVLPIFRRRSAASWTMFLHASAEELESELEWAQSRPSSKAHGVPTDIVLASKQPYRKVLSDWEAENLRMYKSLARCRVYSINQCVASGFAVMSSDTTLHTLIHNPTFHWCDSIAGMTVNGIHHNHDRWLSASELCTAMGFATDVGNSYGRSCCSYTNGRKRSRQVVIAQLGNSMHVAVSSMLLTYVLACVNLIGGDDDV